MKRHAPHPGCHEYDRTRSQGTRVFDAAHEPGLSARPLSLCGSRFPDRDLVRYFCEDITVKGTWEGPAALELFHHALAPVAALPVLEMICRVHIQSDLTLGLGLAGFMTTLSNEGRSEPIAWHVKDWHALTQLDNLCGR
jgi:hypothetical protein